VKLLKKINETDSSRTTLSCTLADQVYKFQLYTGYNT